MDCTMTRLAERDDYVAISLREMGSAQSLPDSRPCWSCASLQRCCRDGSVALRGCENGDDDLNPPEPPAQCEGRDSDSPDDHRGWFRSGSRRINANEVRFSEVCAVLKDNRVAQL